MEVGENWVVTAFVPGLQLSGQFYGERVAPVLSAAFPGLRYSAALLGRGSEVLGFDDEMSMDHDWNPRVQLFVGSGDLVERGEAIEDCLRRDVPGEFRGRPVSVSVFSVGGYFEEQLAIDVRGDIEARDWLTLPEHRLRMLTAGKVFHDEVGLVAARLHELQRQLPDLTGGEGVLEPTFDGYQPVCGRPPVRRG